MTPEQALERGARAEKLLADPMFAEALDTVREQILKNIEAAPIRDHEGVHELRLMLKLLRGVRGHIEQAVRDGKVIVHRLEEKRRISPAEFSAGFRS
jgi:hypothetical protein